MAIEYVLLLKENGLSVEDLTKKVASLGYCCDRLEKLDKGIGISLQEEIGFSIFLVDSPRFPYNRWETIFLSNDFTFQKVLRFRFNKDYDDYRRRYIEMLETIFDLMDEIKQDAILVRDEVELCYFRKDNQIILNNESGIWDKECFRDFIQNKNIRYIDTK